MDTEKDLTILHILDEYEGSEKTALLCGGEALTYRQLLHDAKQIARGLAAEGVKKGDRVLYCMRRTANAIRGLFGILYAGAAYVSVDPGWPQERIQYIAKDGNTVFAMTEETCRRLLEKQPAAMEAGEREIEGAGLPKIRSQDEAAVYYTSGSTGLPKGVVLRHAAFTTALGSAFSSRILNKDLRFPWEISVCFFSLPFVAAIIDICIIFSAERTMLLPTDREQYDAGLLTELIERYRPDIVASTPSVILRFLERPDFARAFEGFKYVFFGGERLTGEVAKKITQATRGDVIVIYGSTEMFFSAEFFYRNDGRIHLGKPGYGVRFYLLDDDREEISPGQEGGLYIGGLPAQNGHYLDRPDLDEETYLEHPRYGRLFRTGDLARLETDGEITIIGRLDGMVKLHGQRIEIGEVENAMASFPGVHRAAAVLRKMMGQEALCGFYTADEELDERALRRHLAKRVPLYMIPAFLRYLPQMPENTHGKLDYRSLPEVRIEKPLVSVLTPVHDMPIELLERAGRSVRAQSYDQERIEWLIAVHNMDDAYLEKVRGAVGEGLNAEIFSVKEPRGILGAARDALLDRASGRYLFWLDGDDELESACIQKSVEAMEQSQADMELFSYEEVLDDGTALFPRRLNLTGEAPVIYEKGDPGLGTLMTGCAGEVWAWCYRRSFVTTTGVRFDEAEAGHFCDSLFVFRLLALARCVVVLPGERNYRFHIRRESDSQNRAWRDAAQTCHELLAVLERAGDLEERSALDMNLFLWFWIRNLSYIFHYADVGTEQKQAVYNALRPYVGRVRVLAPCPAFPKKEALLLADHTAVLFPKEAEGFRQPRWMHRQAFTDKLPSPERVREALQETDYAGFRTLPGGGNGIEGVSPYLGRTEETAAPEVVTVDFRGKRAQERGEALPSEKQASQIQGYLRMEELRGFEPREVPCRITLFILGDGCGEILITWDARFLPSSAIDWVLGKIRE